MKKLTCFLMILMMQSLQAQVEIFEQANEAYAAGRYEEAVALYSEVLAEGKTSAAVHYNLANAHYKLDHIAPSIYHYEKALLLDPGDDDILTNLSFARSMALDALEEEAPGGLEGFFTRTTGFWNADAWAWSAIFCCGLFVVAFLCYYFSQRTLVKRLFFIGSACFLILSVASVAVAAIKTDLQAEEQFAILFAEEIPVRNEPNARGEVVVRLHEGAKVRILEDFQQWYQIRLPSGTQGWLPKSELKLL